MRTQATKASTLRYASLSVPLSSLRFSSAPPLLHLLHSSLSLHPTSSRPLHHHSPLYLPAPSLLTIPLSLFHPKFMLTPSPQMDWIGDKLALLIEQGKKALSREIVVMSDAAEDEVDDASGAWEEQHPAHDRDFVPVHAHSTPAKRRPRPDAPPAAIPPPMPTHSPTPSAVFGAEEREDERAWESAELRELMERARAKARERERERAR